MPTIDGLFVYPIKSCRGIPRQRARLTRAGLECDRQWMVVTVDGRFLTQRELPKLALVETELHDAVLHLGAAGMGGVEVPFESLGRAMEVSIWRDRCAAFDVGDEAAGWLSEFVGRRVRLVRFDPQRRRICDPEYTGAVEALAQFADSFAILAISSASLDDLNTRLPEPLPMNRFRPNLVLGGLPPYGEDQHGDWRLPGVHLRGVKACTRCSVTTTDQDRGIAEGEEPLKTLRGYRWDAQLRGVTFGQNLIVVEGEGAMLEVGQSFD